jgi:hypothetical protein
MSKFVRALLIPAHKPSALLRLLMMMKRLCKCRILNRLIFVSEMLPMLHGEHTNAIGSPSPNLMYKFFILIHLLHSLTCFEHYCDHVQKDNCINTVSGIVTLFGWQFSTQVTRGLNRLHVSSTIVLIFKRTVVLTLPLVSSLSLGDCSVHRLREDWIVYMFRALLCSCSGQLY